MLKKIFKKDRSNELRSGIRAVVNYAKNFKIEMRWIAIFGVVIGILEGIVPYVLGQFFDTLINPTEFSFLGTEYGSWLFWIVLFLVVQLGSNIVNWFAEKYARSLWEKIFLDYQVKAYENFLLKSSQFHKTEAVGKNWESVNRARSWMANILGNEVPSLAPQFLSVIVGLIVCFWINWLLGSVLIFGIAVYVVLGLDLVPDIAEYSRRTNKIYNKIFSSMYDRINNIFEVKRAGTESEENKKNVAEFGKGYANEKILIRLWSAMNLRLNVTVTLTRFAIFLLSVFLVADNKLSVGELIALNGYAGMLFGPFIRFVNIFARMVDGVVKIADAEEILNKPQEVYTSEKLKKFDPKGQVEFKDVHFAYSRKDGAVLRGVNFVATPGKTTALVGKSGSGKSTLVDLIGAFSFPQKGKILVDGVSTKQLELPFLRSHIAYVSQEVTLFNDTVERNIAYGAGRKVGQAEIEEAAKRAHCHEFITEFKKGYKQIVGERGVKLSVGQKQRIAIARAMLRNPTILILDEPTSALDSESERYITQSLDELMRGRTTFIIAHRLSTVRQADQILVMDKGEIVERGDHASLMQIEDGRYQHLYNMHIGLH